MIDKLKTQINLHAFSEVINEFVNSNKTFKECCAEYNVTNIGDMLSTVVVNIAINNFCIEKDVNFDLTDNENYEIDKYSAYDFNEVKILNDKTYSNKQIIREIRNGLEHLSYEIKDDYSLIHIDNQKTGFVADVSLYFVMSSGFAWYDASNINNYLLDDRFLDYSKDAEYNINNLKIYRLKALNKNTNRNSTHFRNKNLKEITLEMLDQSKYARIPRPLDNYQKELLKEYFKNHEVNRTNMMDAIGGILYDESGFSNRQNNYFMFLFSDLSKELEHNDLTYKDLCRKNMEDYNMLETLNNFSKILFITDYYKNIELQTEEDRHIRNCLCHSRYTKIPGEKIVINDHRNGINNEEITTYIEEYNINELYSQVEKRSLDYDRHSKHNK